MIDILKPEEWGNTLIQADDWFFGPDGEQYRAVYGTVSIVKAEDLLGLKPHNSANWFAIVGPPGKQIIIAGCRIHYACHAPGIKPPARKDLLDLSVP